jgi:hypothetical protein
MVFPLIVGFTSSQEAYTAAWKIHLIAIINLSYAVMNLSLTPIEGQFLRLANKFVRSSHLNSWNLDWSWLTVSFTRFNSLASFLNGLQNSVVVERIIVCDDFSSLVFETNSIRLDSCEYVRQDCANAIVRGTYRPAF